MMKSLNELLPTATNQHTPIPYEHSSSGNLSKTELEIQKSFEGYKLSQLNKEEFAKVLAYIFTLVGQRNVPDSTEIFVLRENIMRNYGYLTENEFKLAFQLGIEGKLDCESNSYEKFSYRYVAEILEAFIRRATPIRKMQEQKLDSNPILAPKERNLEDISQIINYSYQNWISGSKNDFNRIFNADKVYSHLWKIGCEGEVPDEINFKLFLTPDKISEIKKDVSLANFEMVDKVPHYERKAFIQKIKDENFLKTQHKKLALVYYFHHIEKKYNLFNGKPF